MSGSLNKVMLIGRLGGAPELKYTPSGTAVAELRLATDRSIQDGEERRQLTDWHNVVVWGKQAEAVAQYTRKGSLINVEGRLQTRSWDGQDGQKRSKTEVVSEAVRFLDRAPQREAESEAAPEPAPEQREQFADPVRALEQEAERDEAEAEIAQ